jgi:hypothetical protein
MKNQEVWRQIPFSAQFEVSNQGSIRSTQTNEIIPLRTDRDGYRRVHLKLDSGGRKHLGVHRIVLEAFVGEANQGYQCNHIDGNPSNNEGENLQTLCGCCHTYKTLTEKDYLTPGRKALGLSY